MSLWFKKRTLKVRHSIVKRMAPRLYQLSQAFYDSLNKAPRPMITYMRMFWGNRPLTGAEIGVAKGENALSILSTLNLKKLYLIDPYLPYVQDGENRSFAACKPIAKANLEGYPQVVFLEKKSDDAVNDVKEQLDFIYIDGNHAFDFVTSDILNYYGKVKSGGFVGGHDYTMFNEENAVRAVNAFVKHNHLEKSFYAVFPDWWVIKQ